MKQFVVCGTQFLFLQENKEKLNNSLYTLVPGKSCFSTFFFLLFRVYDRVNFSRYLMGYLQTKMTTSTMESEYYALSQSAKEAMFLKNVLSEIYCAADPIVLLTESQAALRLSINPLITSNSKHIKKPQHFIRQAVQEKEVSLVHVPTTEMVADFMTKSLPKPKFEHCSEIIGLRNLK